MRCLQLPEARPYNEPWSEGPHHPDRPPSPPPPWWGRMRYMEAPLAAPPPDTLVISRPREGPTDEPVCGLFYFFEKKTKGLLLLVFSSPFVVVVVCLFVCCFPPSPLCADQHQLERRGAAQSGTIPPHPEQDLAHHPAADLDRVPEARGGR